MIRLIIVLIIWSVCLVNTFGVTGDTIRNTNYGVEVNQFITGSGYTAGTELLFSVTEGNRSLKIGFCIGNDVKRVTGIIAHHEVLLLRNTFRRILKPYVFYNCIARITKLEDIDDQTTSTTSGIYKTFEHHIGIGMRVQISGSIYFSGSTGYGLYFGSVKKPEIIEGTNEIAGSNGFAPIVKMGLGIIL